MCLLLLRTYFTGPQLPSEKEGHCQVTLNSTHFFITGGGYDDVDTYIFNYGSLEWNNQQKLPEIMASAACGLVLNENGEQEIVIAKDFSTFVFSMANSEWREGPLLPQSFTNGASVQLRDTFLIVGGRNSVDDTIMNTIYKFDNIDFEWVRLEDADLEIARMDAAAVAIPADFFNCE